MITDASTLSSLSRGRRIAFIKERYKKLVLDTREGLEADFTDAFGDSDISAIEEDDLAYEAN